MQTGLFSRLHCTDDPDWVIGFLISYFELYAAMKKIDDSTRVEGCLDRNQSPHHASQDTGTPPKTPQHTPVSILRCAGELTIQKPANPP